MTAEPLDINKELRDGAFRVSIFGSARIKPEDEIYKDTFKLAKTLAGLDIDLVTGGGPGLMEAAALGHTEGDTNGGAHSIGLNIRLPFEQKPSDGLDLMDTHNRFSTRLDEFMLLSHAVVVMPGGIGTCLELFYTWQLIQVNHICKIPVIVVGDMWRNIINWVIDNPLKHGYMSSSDMDSVVVVDSGEEALAIIKDAKKQWEENPDACLNWKKYRK